MATIMGKIDVLAPASLFAEQRAAFSDAIKNKTNIPAHHARHGLEPPRCGPIC